MGVIDPHQLLIFFVAAVLLRQAVGAVWIRGPFAYIGNPFYSSYLLAMASAARVLPSAIRFLVFAGAEVCAEPLAHEYESYRQ